MVHLLVWPVTETQKHDDEVRGVECLDAFHALARSGVNGAIFAYGEKDGGLEPVTLCHEAGHHGQAFLTAILFIPGEEDDVLAFAGAVFSFKGQDVFTGECACAAEREAKNGGCDGLHRLERWMVGNTKRRRC